MRTKPLGSTWRKKRAQELGGAKSHCAGLATVGVILPAESHTLLLERQQAMIGNGHAMGVATEVAQHLQGTTESGLGINHPVVAMETTQQAATHLRELIFRLEYRNVKQVKRTSESEKVAGYPVDRAKILSRSIPSIAPIKPERRA